MRWPGHVAHMEGKRNSYTNFVGKFERKRRLGRQGVGGKNLKK